MRIESHHRSLPTWLALALVAGGAGLAWCAAASDWHDTVRAHLAILGFGIAFGIPIQWSVRGRWFELTDFELRSHRGTELLRSWLVSDATKVETLPGMYFVRFADGSRVWIDHTRPGGPEILDAFRDRLRRATPEGVSSASGADDLHERLLPLAHLRFPDPCIRCGSPATATWKLTATHGIHIPNSFQTFADAPVPVCARCKWQRRRLGVAVYLAPLVAVSLAAKGIVVIRGGIDEAFGTFIAGAIVAGIGVMVFAPTLLSRVTDARFLGVSSLGLSRDHGSMRLRFRDPMLAIEVARLTANAEFRPR